MQNCYNIISHIAPENTLKYQTKLLLKPSIFVLLQYCLVKG